MIALVVGSAIGLLSVGALATIAMKRKVEDARHGWTTRKLLVTTRDLAEGEPLTAESLTESELPERFVSDSFIAAPDRSIIAGKKASLPIQKGDFLVWGHFAQPLGGPLTTECIERLRPLVSQARQRAIEETLARFEKRLGAARPSAVAPLPEAELEVVVALEDLPEGEPLGRERLGARRLPPGLATASHVPARYLDAAALARAVVPFQKGDPLRWQMLDDPEVPRIEDLVRKRVPAGRVTASIVKPDVLENLINERLALPLLKGDLLTWTDLWPLQVEPAGRGPLPAAHPRRHHGRRAGRPRPPGRALPEATRRPVKESVTRSQPPSEKWRPLHAGGACFQETHMYRLDSLAAAALALTLTASGSALASQSCLYDGFYWVNADKGDRALDVQVVVMAENNRWTSYSSGRLRFNHPVYAEISGEFAQYFSDRFLDLDPNVLIREQRFSWTAWDRFSLTFDAAGWGTLVNHTWGGSVRFRPECTGNVVSAPVPGGALFMTVKRTSGLRPPT